ncbi:MAG: phytanoyl-CoA dioxygenase family protein, partial [Pseudomonadota bacterium]
MDNVQLEKTFRKSGIEKLPDDTQLKKYADIFLEELRNRDEESLISETVMKNSNTTIRTIFGVHRQSEIAAKMAKLPVLRDTVNAILQQPNYLLQSQINFKPTGMGSGFPAHRDVHYFYNRDG